MSSPHPPRELSPTLAPWVHLVRTHSRLTEQTTLLRLPAQLVLSGRGRPSPRPRPRPAPVDDQGDGDAGVLGQDTKRTLLATQPSRHAQTAPSRPWSQRDGDAGVEGPGPATAAHDADLQAPPHWVMMSSFPCRNSTAPDETPFLQKETSAEGPKTPATIPPCHGILERQRPPSKTKSTRVHYSHLGVGCTLRY